MAIGNFTKLKDFNDGHKDDWSIQQIDFIFPKFYENKF